MFVFVMMSYLTPEFCDFGEIDYSIPREIWDGVTFLPILGGSSVNKRQNLISGIY